MKQSKTFALLVVVAALVVAVLAPAGFAESADVTMKLKGPDSAANGAMIQLTATIKNPMKADGYRVALILQHKNGDLKRIGSKAITWTNGGRTGTVSFWVKAQASAMGIAKYRASWMHPGGTTHSNRLGVEID